MNASTAFRTASSSLPFEVTSLSVSSCTTNTSTGQAHGLASACMASVTLLLLTAVPMSDEASVSENPSPDTLSW